MKTSKRKDPKIILYAVDGPWKGAAIALTEAYGLHTAPLAIGGDVGQYREVQSARSRTRELRWQPIA